MSLDRGGEIDALTVYRPDRFPCRFGPAGGLGDLTEARDEVFRCRTAGLEVGVDKRHLLRIRDGLPCRRVHGPIEVHLRHSAG